MPDLHPHYGTESDTALQIAPNEARNKNGESLQDIVRDLMLTVLEEYPGTLDEETIRQLEVTKNPLGLNISGHTLLRDVSEGRLVGRHNRYWNRLYGGRWYVCSQWWAHAHRHNAEMLANWVDCLRADVGQNEVFSSLSDIRNSALRRLSARKSAIDDRAGNDRRTSKSAPAPADPPWEARLRSASLAPAPGPPRPPCTCCRRSGDARSRSPGTAPAPRPDAHSDPRRSSSSRRSRTGT